MSMVPRSHAKTVDSDSSRSGQPPSANPQTTASQNLSRRRHSVAAHGPVGHPAVKIFQQQQGRRGSLQPPVNAEETRSTTPQNRVRRGSVDVNAVRWSDLESSKSNRTSDVRGKDDDDVVSLPTVPDASQLIETLICQLDEAVIAGNRQPLPKPSGTFAMAASLDVSE